MIYPTAQLPNATYIDGLRLVDAAVFETIYNEFRRPVARAVESAGGGMADGYTFFRVAVLHASVLLEKGQMDENIPVFYILKNLAVAHFRDWATEKNLELPDLLPPNEDEAAYPFQVPGADERLDFRQYIRARRQFSRLENNCKGVVQEHANDAALSLNDPRPVAENAQHCLDQYRRSLSGDEETWGNGLPPAVVGALTDDHFIKAWNTAEAQEGKLALGESSRREPVNHTARNLFILLALLTVGYAVWNFFYATKTPKAVYEENFQPPAGIMEDRAARLAKDSVSGEPNPMCEQTFELADQYYRKKDYAQAAEVLYDLTGDETEECKSDALFYLGIIALQINEPELTLECLAKIPDLERFGEDLYWYQALAFVKIAAHNPSRKDVARRAVERARSNTEIPGRRTQAEKMLQQLGE